MLKKIGMYIPPSEATTSAAVNRVYWLPHTAAQQGDVKSSYVVELGDRLKKVSSAMYSAGTVSAKIGIYRASESGTPDLLLSEYTVTSVEDNRQDYKHLDVDFDMSAWEGLRIIPACGLWSGARFLLKTGISGSGARYYQDQMPESGGNGTGGDRLPLYYIEIESPPPDGYSDIVVGETPIYGDDRSVIKEFTGEPPKAGDQIRYALKSLNGADVVVNPDLTYTGTYPEDIEIPSDDVLYFAVLNEATGEWVDWTVTVNFDESPSEGITVITPPEITGSPVVRQELTCNPGSYTSPNGPVSIIGYTWYVDGVPVQGVHTNTFTPVDSSYGKVVSCAVQVTDGVNTESYSASTTPLAGIAPQVTLSPVKGKPEVGRTVRVNVSVDAVPEADVIIEWVRVGDDEVLSTGSNAYRITEDDLGESIFPRVTASNLEGEATEDGTPIGPITPFVEVSRRNLPPFWQ